MRYCSSWPSCPSASKCLTPYPASVAGRTKYCLAAAAAVQMVQMLAVQVPQVLLLMWHPLCASACGRSYLARLQELGVLRRYVQLV